MGLPWRTSAPAESNIARMPGPDVQHIEDISNAAAPNTAEDQQDRNNDKARPELITIGPFWRDGQEHYETRVRLADTDYRKCLSPTLITGRQLGAPILDWSQVVPQNDEPAADDAFVGKKVNTDRAGDCRGYARRLDPLELEIKKRHHEPPKRWNRRLGKYVHINSSTDLEVNRARSSKPTHKESLEALPEGNELDLTVRRKGDGPPAWTENRTFSKPGCGTHGIDSHSHTSSSQSGDYILSDQSKPQKNEDLDDFTSDVPRAMHVSSSSEFDVEEALIWGAAEVSQNSKRKEAVESTLDDAS